MSRNHNIHVLYNKEAYRKNMKWLGLYIVCTVYIVSSYIHVYVHVSFVSATLQCWYSSDWRV